MREFETERLVIRPWSDQEPAEAYPIFSDPEVGRWLRGGTPDMTPDEVWERFRDVARQYRGTPKPWRFWAVQTKLDQRLVGTVILTPLDPEESEIEIGWHFPDQVWGKGYAAEVARRVLRYAFDELELPAIQALFRPGNEKAISTCRRLGTYPKGLTSKYYGMELEHFEIPRFRPTA